MKRILPRAYGLAVIVGIALASCGCGSPRVIQNGVAQDDAIVAACARAQQLGWSDVEVRDVTRTDAYWLVFIRSSSGSVGASHAVVEVDAITGEVTWHGGK